MTWTAEVFNTRASLELAAQGRGGDFSFDHPDLLVVGLPGNENREETLERDVFTFIDEDRPRLVVWENVRGLASAAAEEARARIKGGFTDRGYAVTGKTLSRSAFTRRDTNRFKRFWIIAADQRLDLPDPPKLPRERPVEHIPGADPTLWAILATNGF